VTHVGIDLEQFFTDPYNSGIQRVLQYLAREWPTEDVSCDFIAPWEGDFLLLSPNDAVQVIDAAFAARDIESVRGDVSRQLAFLAQNLPRVGNATLLSYFDTWLMPEVSYLPQVLERLALMQQTMPCTMIGYDALPMTDPDNYRFRPGSADHVSEYFRLLTMADSVVCISDYTRETILGRLRRNPALATTVAHPGGDHVPIAAPHSEGRGDKPVTFLRVGTMEARKYPRQVVEAFQAARSAGVDAHLAFFGRPSASDSNLNRTVRAACDEDPAVTWVESASDSAIRDAMERADVFLSVGTEGYGIPVLESIRRGTPVLFGGIQPAGEIMAGKGAHPLGAPTVEELAEAFRAYSEPSAVLTLLDTLRPSAVPRWSDFTRAVAYACVG
jgi:glycosyltransferase involved in cell wall biosynthesis